MSNEFEKINAEFNKTRRDLHFSVEDLNKLANEERQIIENKIIDCIKVGEKSSYKYIPFLKISDPEDYLRNKDIKSLPIFDQAEVYFYLYQKTKNNHYIENIVELAKESLEVYSFLTILYADKKIDKSMENNVYSAIVSLSNVSEKYKKLYEKRKENLEMSKDNIHNALIGFAVGDAIGVPVEFTKREERKANPVTEMLEYGSHNVPIGTWSDDTSMTVACMDSIIAKEEIDYDDIMNKFVNWVSKAHYTATDKVFDVGGTTIQAIYNYKSGKRALESGLSDQRSNGNGSLMRMVPIVYYLAANNFSDSEETEIINNYSSLTHAHEISQLGCKIYADFLKQLIKNKSKEEAYSYIKQKDYTKSYSPETVNLYKRILKDDIRELPENEIASSGYVLSTLEASLWTTLNSSSYEEAIVKAINLGGDTDTIGAIAGSLNGAIYGASNIPKRWLNVLKKKDYLENKCEQFTIALKHIKEDNRRAALQRAYYDRMTEDAFHIDKEKKDMINEYELSKNNSTISSNNKITM